ncbi:SRPBCC domain-containing protein [Candidatus Saccharibacteria bacterium]|nr:SRPBCC domain-containing protein [Candidatus Saccharibacteria bacterium]MCA9312928.1 SRPBCC domain-containing protein [Candidatus Saccharibacteria bacterium]
MNKTNFTISEDKKSLIMERVFQASQHNLWRAYTEKELFEQWFAPQGWTVTTKKFDFTESGENIYVMKCEDKAQGEWYGQVSAGKNMSAKRNCVSYSKPLSKNTIIRLRYQRNYGQK